MPPTHPVGLIALLTELGLSIDPPAIRSVVGPFARRTEERAEETRESYPLRYQCTTLRDHLRFALKYEPLDLRVWKAIMMALPPSVIEEWVREQPGESPRRAWYLYEHLALRQLDLPDAKSRKYVDLADRDLQFTLDGGPLNSRCLVRANLLGSSGYCPLVRRTRQLQEQIARSYRDEVQRLTSEIDPILFRRAADFLYLAETKSSYAIEGETPAKGREERFVQVLAHAGDANVTSEAGLVALQNLIVQDPRFLATGWRTVQNYVGRTRPDYSEEVAYPCPKPADVPGLMGAWISSYGSMARGVDPVVMAACASFGFVYLHPFEDGNGRLHRFIIHHALAQQAYTPEGVIFPVSSAMYRRRKEYESVLQTFSRLVTPYVQYELDDQNRMTVLNDTADLYRYPDLTRHAEFLYQCIGETLRQRLAAGIAVSQSIRRRVPGRPEHRRYARCQGSPAREATAPEQRAPGRSQARRVLFPARRRDTSHRVRRAGGDGDSVAAPRMSGW